MSKTLAKSPFPKHAVRSHTIGTTAVYQVPSYIVERKARFKEQMQVGQQQMLMLLAKVS